MKLVTLATFGAISLGLVHPAHAASPIGFDDLSGGSISDGYGGLDWANFSVLNGSSSGPSGYFNAVVSANHVAYNPYGDPAQISSSSAFNFTSAYIGAAWNDNLQVLVSGFLNNSPVFSRQLTVSTSGATFFDFGNASVDRVNFTSFGGVRNPNYSGIGSHFAIDNLVVNGQLSSAVPEPATWAMLLLGFGFVGGAMRSAKRRQKLTVSYA